MQAGNRKSPVGGQDVNLTAVSAMADCCASPVAAVILSHITVAKFLQNHHDIMGGAFIWN